MVVVLFLLSCAQSEFKAIRFGLSSAPLTLDPRYSTDAASTRIIRLLYLQLTDFNQQVLPSPALAKWSKLSPTHYRFRLGEKGRNFHNGERLNAEDVKATYDSVLDPATASPHKQSLDIVKSIRIINKDTVDFILHRPDSAFPGYLVIGIMPKALLNTNHDFVKSPIGSGPFRFHAWPDSSLLKLTRLRDNQAFVFLHVENATTRVLKLIKGEIDIVQNDIPGELVKHLETFYKIKVQHHLGSNFSYMSFNFRNPHLKKIEVRRAIAHAIDRRKIVKYFFGKKTKLASAIFSPEHWAGHKNLLSYDYNPAKARKLLAQAGYNKENPLELTYKTTNKPFRVRIATVLQHQLAQVGIKIKLRTYEWATFYDDIQKGNFHLYSLTWVGVKSPDIFRTVYHSSSIPDSEKKKFGWKTFRADLLKGFVHLGSLVWSSINSVATQREIYKSLSLPILNRKNSGKNRNAYRDEVADYLIELAEKESNRHRRIAHFYKIHERLIERLPVIPLWYEEHMAATRSNIFAYTLTADGNYDSLVNVVKLKPGEKVPATFANYRLKQKKQATIKVKKFVPMEFSDPDSDPVKSKSNSRKKDKVIIHVPTAIPKSNLSPDKSNDLKTDTAIMPKIRETSKADAKKLEKPLKLLPVKSKKENDNNPKIEKRKSISNEIVKQKNKLTLPKAKDSSKTKPLNATPATPSELAK